MKNLLTLFMTICTMLLVSCTSSTPSGTVRKAFDALIDNDFETYARSFYVEDQSDPERVEKDIRDLVKLLERNAKDQSDDEKIKSYEIQKEEKSKTGKWVKIPYRIIYQDDSTTESDFYLTQDDNGDWKIQMFGTERLMDE